MSVIYSDIVDRMKLITGLGYDSDLAKILEITPQAISNFKKKGKLPSDLVIKFALEHKVSVDWLLTGEWDEKSAIAVLRKRISRSSRPLDSFLMDTPMTLQQLSTFIRGECRPSKGILILLSKRAGGPCRDDDFLKAIAGGGEEQIQETFDRQVKSEGLTDDVWQEKLASTIEELKRVFDKFENLVKEGKNPVLYMGADELEIIADREIWKKVKQIDESLKKKLGRDQNFNEPSGNVTQTVTGKGHKVAGRDIIEGNERPKK
ncbi:helix-turn-helix domain-containing protein [Geobacter sp.]|uniref:helix-turn-helix domain-containing protein n=1 Tax=Geobacter sp. TaxID=46610 RepID=UPI0027BA3351|nr:helix-turn-helix domain-containing protein [Geobacter sp.]